MHFYFLFPKSTTPWNMFPRKKNWKKVFKSSNGKNCISHEIYNKFISALKTITKIYVKNKTKHVLVEELLQGILLCKI